VKTKRILWAWRNVSCLVAVLALGVALLLASSGLAFANQIWIGIHGGPSIPSLQGGTNEISSGYSSRFGPYFGIFADYEIRPYLALRGEINYSSEGGKRNGMQPIIPDASLPIPSSMTVYGVFDNTTILDYLEIPLLAKLQWGSSTRLFIDAGPYVGFLVRAKTVTRGSSLLYADASGTPLLMPPDYEPLPANFDNDENIKQDINSMNTGIGGGIGVEVPWGDGNFVLDAHFSYGLNSIQRDTELNGENNTGMLAFTVGYSHPLGGRR
jgi:hypothetical protein